MNFDDDSNARYFEYTVHYRIYYLRREPLFTQEELQRGLTNSYLEKYEEFNLNGKIVGRGLVRTNDKHFAFQLLLSPKVDNHHITSYINYHSNWYNNRNSINE